VVLFAIAGQLATVVRSIIVALILAATLAPYVADWRARGWGRSKAAAGAILAIGDYLRKRDVLLRPEDEDLTLTDPGAITTA
jgi:uncharacterized membrane protein